MYRADAASAERRLLINNTDRMGRHVASSNFFQRTSFFPRRLFFSFFSSFTMKGARRGKTLEKDTSERNVSLILMRFGIKLEEIDFFEITGRGRVCARSKEESTVGRIYRGVWQGESASVPLFSRSLLRRKNIRSLSTDITPRPRISSSRYAYARQKNVDRGV